MTKTYAGYRSHYGSLTRYVKLRVTHAPGMPGTFSPVTAVRHACVVMHAGIANNGFLPSRWRRKRSRHSRRMRNPQFHVSGKRPPGAHELTNYIQYCAFMGELWNAFGEYFHFGENESTHLLDKNGRHLADDISICIFVNEMFCIWSKHLWSLFLSVQLTITENWFRECLNLHRIGDKPSESTLTRFTDAYICGTRRRWVKICSAV